ncbi:MAG TPA: hypothetical protein VF807_07970 [Ktedonobacterales bacterium]
MTTTTEDAPARVSPADLYAARRERYAAERAAADQGRNLSANLTVAAFFLALIASLLPVFGLPRWLWIVAALAFVAFVALFAVQARRDAAYRRADLLCQLAAEGEARLRRDWLALPLRDATPAPEGHPYAADLDLMGHGSLLHLLGGTGTLLGLARLREWMLSPASPDEIGERQAAVSELAGAVDLRWELAQAGRQSELSAVGLERFLAWAEGEPWLRRRPALVWASRLLPLALVALAILQVTGVVHSPWWILALLGNLVVQFLGGKAVEERIDAVSDRRATFLPWREMAGITGGHAFTAPRLARLRGVLRDEAPTAMEGLGALQRILSAVDFRLSWLFAIVQVATLYTFHVLWLLEGWRTRYGARARIWADTLTELDALSALAALRFENPAWALPEITPLASSLVSGEDLGHPLLAPEVCVGNAVTVGPPGTFLLVTGSNMSGKSTLLRALGVNIVLAQLGGPVCATALRLPPVTLATSMRVRDSLTEGVSYYMAELYRLRLVMDEMTAASTAGDRLPVFLLDEMLHGTNTSERQIAARRVLRHLTQLGATGVVSTHDLTLAASPEMDAISQKSHFSEHFTRGENGPVMRFDYRLLPGLATSSNALTLMEIVGLPGEGGNSP